MQERATHNQGSIITYSPADPLPGANLLQAVPVGVRWIVKSIVFTLTTDANVAVRYSTLIVYRSTDLVHSFRNSYGLGATDTLVYLHQADTTTETTPIAGAINTEIAGGLLLDSNCNIQTDILNIQAGDQISDVVIFAEEFIDPY